MSHKVWRVARQFIQKRIGRMPRGTKNFIIVSQYSYQVLQPYLPKGARIFHVPNPIDITQQPAVEVATNDDILIRGPIGP